MTIRRLLTCVAFLLTVAIPVIAQDYTPQAKQYFKSYLDSKALIDLALKALPTMDDCKAVFKDKNAYTYYGYIEDMKTMMQEEAGKAGEVFKAVNVTTHTSCDLERSQGDFPGGMIKCIGSFHPNVTFYEVTLLREEGDAAGVSYKYWIRIDGRWVFFPKPWRVCVD